MTIKVAEIPTSKRGKTGRSERSRGTPRQNVQWIRGILRLRCASLRMTVRI